MIPIDTSEAHRAFNDKKINMWALTFIEGVHKQDFITEVQYDKLIEIAETMLPYKLLITTTPFNNNGCPVDPYFNQQYYIENYEFKSLPD